MAENRELALVLKLVADEFKSELKNSQGALGQFNDFIKDWKTQLAAAGTALFAVAKSTANFGEEALKTSQRLGTTVEITTALQHAAYMADVPIGTLEKGLKTLAQAAVQASSGSGDGAKLFTQLGLSATDATGKMKPLDQLFLELQDRLNGTRSQAEFLDAGTKALGKSFLEMVPLVRQGSDATKAAMEDAKRLGVVLGQEDAEAASRFNDELKRLQAAMQGVHLELGRQLIPALLEFMETFKSITATGGVQFFFKGLAEQAVLFSTLIKEAAANVEFLFGKFTFDQLKTEIKRLEAEASAKLMLLENPEAAKYVNGPPKAETAQTGRDVSMGATVPRVVDQEKLGKAKLEIFLMQNRALEIQAKLAREAAQGESEFFLAFDRQQQFQREDEAEQVRRGQAIVQQTQLEVQLREAASQRERAGLVENAQAWIAYDNQVGASTELRYQHQLELLQASLAQQLQITREQSGQLIEAWKEIDSEGQAAILDQTRLNAQERETIELQTLTQLAAINQQYSGSIVEGWSLGLQKYVQDHQSAFGFAADMARRTAQYMEQSFRTFFFDLMDGRIKSMKDLFKGFGDFVKNVIAQVMAQLATMMVFKAITGGFSGGLLGNFFSGFMGSGGGGADAGGLLGGLRFNAGGIVPQRFASGGAVLGAGNRDTVAAMLTPGEGVLNRRGMATLDRLNAGDLPTSQPMNVTVNVHNSGRTDAPQVNYRRQLKGMIVDIIWRDPDLRQALGGAA